MPEVIWLVIGAVVGIALGFVVTRFLVNASTKRAAQEAEAVLADAKRQAETLRREAIVEAKDEALKLQQEAQIESKERLREVRTAESRVSQREESLDRRVESLDAREHQISSMQGQLERRERDIDEAAQEVNHRLERVAGMTPEEAKAELLDTLKDEVVHESAAIIRDAEARTKAEADKKARSILSLAIQRVAADHSAENTVSAIHIPSDDLKGRIIGREGRNIRSFEQLTGTNLIIDDTPECVTISCFDPVRREIGRVTMENLVADGRIHPARIEEMFGKAESFVNQRVQEAGEQASFDTGIHDLHPEIVHTLGRLRYRTSYGLRLPIYLVLWLLNWVLILFQLSVLVFYMTSAKLSIMRLRVAMQLLALTLHVVSVRGLRSYMLSKRTTTMWSHRVCWRYWSRPQMLFLLLALGRVKRRSMLTSSVLRSLRKLRIPIRAWSARTPFRLDVRSVLWWSPRWSMRLQRRCLPMTLRIALRMKCSIQVR